MTDADDARAAAVKHPPLNTVIEELRQTSLRRNDDPKQQDFILKNELIECAIHLQKLAETYQGLAPDSVSARVLLKEIYAVCTEYTADNNLALHHRVVVKSGVGEWLALANPLQAAANSFISAYERKLAEAEEKPAKHSRINSSGTDTRSVA